MKYHIYTIHSIKIIFIKIAYNPIIILNFAVKLL